VRQIIGVALLAFLGLGAGASGAQVEAGRDYVILDAAADQGRAPASAANPDHIEVVEFFSYACPHCAHLEPQLEKWQHALPAKVILRRVPVTFGRDEWDVLARFYYTLEATHQVDALHARVFTALHGDHATLFSPDALADWMARQGKDRRAFLDSYNSFSVQVHLQAGNALAQQLGIESVPSFVVAGRYRTDLDMARDYGRLLGIVDELVRKSASPASGKR